MEKTIIFLPIILFFGFFAILVIGFLALVIKLVLKGKADHWVGTCVDKKYFQRRDSDNPHKMNEYFSLIFKTDDGKDKKVAVARMIYDQYKVGDRAKKEKGELYIKKI